MGFFGDVKNGSFWKYVAARHDVIVKLKDLQAMEDAMNAGNVLVMDDYTVSCVKRYKHVEANAEWIFFELSGKQTLYLMVRVVGDCADAYIMMTEDSAGVKIVAGGNREDLLERGDHFLFCAPDDESNFVPADLVWTSSFVFEFVSEGEEAEFIQEEMGTQYAEVDVYPHDEVLQGVLCGITEFFTKEKVDNPHFVIVEEGIDWDPDVQSGKQQGGLCTFFVGCPVGMSEIEVSFPA